VFEDNSYQDTAIAPLGGDARGDGRISPQARPRRTGVRREDDRAPKRCWPGVSGEPVFVRCTRPAARLRIRRIPETAGASDIGVDCRKSSNCIRTVDQRDHQRSNPHEKLFFGVARKQTRGPDQRGRFSPSAPPPPLWVFEKGRPGTTTRAGRSETGIEWRRLRLTQTWSHGGKGLVVCQRH